MLHNVPGLGSIRISDLICENRPLPTFFGFEKNSSEVCVVTQQIDYSSYFNQIFSIASAGHDLHDPEIPGENEMYQIW